MKTGRVNKRSQTKQSKSSKVDSSLSIEKEGARLSNFPRKFPRKLAVKSNVFYRETWNGSKQQQQNENQGAGGRSWERDVQNGHKQARYMRSNDEQSDVRAKKKKGTIGTASAICWRSHDSLRQASSECTNIGIVSRVMRRRNNNSCSLRWGAYYRCVVNECAEHDAHTDKKHRSTSYACNTCVTQAFCGMYKWKCAWTCV